MSTHGGTQQEPAPRSLLRNYRYCPITDPPGEARHMVVCSSCSDPQTDLRCRLRLTSCFLHGATLTCLPALQIKPSLRRSLSTVRDASASLLASSSLRVDYRSRSSLWFTLTRRNIAGTCGPPITGEPIQCKSFIFPPLVSPRGTKMAPRHHRPTEPSGEENLRNRQLTSHKQAIPAATDTDKTTDPEPTISVGGWSPGQGIKGG